MNQKTRILLPIAIFIAIFTFLPSDDVNAASMPSCSLSGDVVVDFGEVLFADRSPNKMTTSTYIRKGIYDIKVMTWDDHSGHGGQNQHNETVWLKLKDASGNTVAETNSTSDISENRDTKTSTVANNIELDSRILSVVAIHTAHPSSNPESVTPICASFNKVGDIEEPEPEDDISVSCSVSDTSIEEGDDVRYSVDVDGGNYPFDYDWSGDTEGENENDNDITVTYDDEGSYSVTVTVTDEDGNSDSDTCPTVRVEEDEEEEDDLEIRCEVSDTSIEEGDEVRYSVDIDGGNSPFDYNWDGDLEGEDDDNSTVRVEYDDEGSYHVSVTVTDDDGNRDSDDCPTVRVEDDDDDDDLSISCEVSDTSIDEGDSVRYSVDIDGGDSPFEYEWDGDIEGEDDDNSTIRVEYDDEGSYHVEVTVWDDDGNRDSDDCPTVRVDEDDDDDDLRVRCEVSDTSIDEGDRITIEVDIDGGDSPYDIEWDGDIHDIDDFDDDRRSQRVEIDDEGRYYIDVTVEDDDGNRDSDDCPVIRVGDDDDNDINVFTKNSPDGNLAGVSSVFLSQVPYTGTRENIIAISLFSLFLLIWSVVIANAFYKRHLKKIRSSEIQAFKDINRLG